MPHVTLVTHDAELATTVQELCRLAGAALTISPGGDLTPGMLLIDAEHPLADPPDRGHLVSLREHRTALRLPEQAAELYALLVSATEDSTQRAVHVFGAAGGVGVSTLALGLALAVEGWLIDADPRRTGLELLAGVEVSPGLRWPQLLTSRGPLPGSVLHGQLAALPGDSRILSWPTAGSAPVSTQEFAERCRAVVEAGLGAGHGVVIDRSGQPIGQNLGATDRAVLLLPATVRGVIAARSMLAQHPASAVVRRGSLSLPELEHALGQPVAACLPEDPTIPRQAERGDLVHTLRSARWRHWLQDLDALLAQEVTRR